MYLTALFLGPVRELYSYKNRNRSKMRTMAFRTFVGVCFTLTTSVVNLSILTKLEGEQGWICLLICTSDGEQDRVSKDEATANKKQCSCR